MQEELLSQAACRIAQSRGSFACPGTGEHHLLRDFQPRSTSRWTTFSTFGASCVDGPWIFTNPQRTAWTCRESFEIHRYQLRALTESNASGASWRHCSSNLKLSAYLRLHYSMLVRPGTSRSFGWSSLWPVLCYRKSCYAPCSMSANEQVK